MSPLPQAAKTAITLLVLALVLALGAWWGWSSLTSPFTDEADSATGCTTVDVAKGDEVTTSMVEVDVLNSGTRTSLASTVMEELVARGYLEGTAGNSETEVKTVQVWTPSRKDPGLALLLTSMPKGTAVKVKDDVDVLTVVLGDGWTSLRSGKTSIKAQHAGTLCEASDSAA
ncbi:LytR C-terminal domain-containing protein [Nocardioides sp. GY 10127]|uniref:LytR C-terminal domain-containing protein n=1 Tax=Nocardioides sp. GY 10127 TaxID=2569762 RepID=UPI0010A860FD|nr:LytR C-terminal domain-containing protein [Nocardioides sp. GY 10127]TIC82534.1 LytR family transcriptional regulator [Nocardioides sp. GY 10127]